MFASVLARVGNDIFAGTVFKDVALAGPSLEWFDDEQ